MSFSRKGREDRKGFGGFAEWGIATKNRNQSCKSCNPVLKNEGNFRLVICDLPESSFVTLSILAACG
ncbi:MAG: hypothetical protein ACOX9C_09355 [Kiritimatiellia bacterium]|jgi:hypothetical protein